MIGSVARLGRGAQPRQTSMPEAPGSIQSSSDQVGLLLVDGEHAPPRRRPRPSTSKPSRLEVVAEQLGLGVLVLDDQHLRLRVIAACGIACALAQGCTTVKLVTSSFGRWSAGVRPCTRKYDDLGDVGGVIADPLDVLGDEQQMRAGGDVARIFHHVGQQLAEELV